jgi:hypothetical protein
MTVKSGKNTMEQMKKGTPIKLKNYIKLMHALGFIHVKSRSLSEEEMLTDIWKLLGGTNENFVKAENLFVVLAGIMNIQIPDIIRKQDFSSYTRKCLLYYDEYNNTYFGSYEDIIKINQKYMALTVNRKSQKRKGSSASVNRS